MSLQKALVSIKRLVSELYNKVMCRRNPRASHLAVFPQLCLASMKGLRDEILIQSSTPRTPLAVFSRTLPQNSEEQKVKRRKEK